jgi:hypothetical protein
MSSFGTLPVAGTVPVLYQFTVPCTGTVLYLGLRVLYTKKLVENLDVVKWLKNGEATSHPLLFPFPLNDEFLTSNNKPSHEP